MDTMLELYGMLLLLTGDVAMVQEVAAFAEETSVHRRRAWMFLARASAAALPDALLALDAAVVSQPRVDFLSFLTGFASSGARI
jgi:hypothetical protein